MTTTKRLILAATATAALGASALSAQAVTAAPSQGNSQARAFDGDADVLGSRVYLQAETTASTTSVTFRYGGRSRSGQLVENDLEDGSKDWGRSMRALRSDRRPGRTVKFSVRACDGAGCTTTTFKDFVEFDD